MRRLLAVLAATAIAAFVVVVSPASAQPVPGPDGPPAQDMFEQPNFQTATYGDFAEIGNSVLRCPGDTDPTHGGGTSAQCVAASQGEPPPGTDNDSFYLQRNGSDGAAVFDSSTAQLTVPTGATVQYAQLDWGGNTGRTDIDIGLPDPLASVGLPPVSCTGLRLLSLLPNLLAPAQLPPPPAAPGPDQQNLQLSVRPVTSTAAGPAVPVEPTNFGTAGKSTKLYSAYADVTSSIAAAVSSTDSAMPTTLDVTVGNVWAVSGFGCAAGWSLTVVFGYPSPPTDPTNAYQHLREIDVYTGRLVQGAGGTALSLPEPNVDANTAGVEVGLTAFHGDPSHSGTLTVGGRPQADPCGAPDFFSSCALGALDPLQPGTFVRDNFSVDAKAIVPATASASDPPGSAVDVGLSGASRPYLLQSIVISEDINPSIGVTMAGTGQPVHAGDPASVQVMVRNTGDVPLHNVALTVGPADTNPDCRPTVAGTLAPGDTQAVACTLTTGQSTFTAMATATGNYRLNDPRTGMSGSATATITVVGPMIAVAVAADPPVVLKGAPAPQVTLTFTVTNNSVPDEGPLDATVATDPALPGCTPAPVNQIQPGFAGTTTCTFAPTADVTLTASATATSPTFPADKATATSAKLGVGVISPALAIAVTADPATVPPGGPVNFTVAVHNTGDVALALAVTDDVAQACDFTTGSTGLAPGVAQSQECTVTAPSGVDSLTDTAKFTATPVGHTATGIPITGPAAGFQLTGQATGTTTISATAGTNGSPGAGGGGGSSPLPGGGTNQNGGAPQAGGPGSTGGGTPGQPSTPSRLAYTGVAIGAPLALGAGLVAIGFVVSVRRRRGDPPEPGLSRRGLTVRRSAGRR